MCLGVFFSHSAYAECSIGMVTSGNVNIRLMPGNSGVETSNITATTDCEAGYTIYINGPQDTNLYNSGDDTSEDYISAVSGTKAQPTALSADTYGYTLGSATATSDAFIGLTGASTILTTTAEASQEGGDNYTVSYGVSVSANKPAGTYQMSNDGVVTYTILANGIGTNFVTFDANGGLFQNNETTNQITIEQDTTSIISGTYQLPTRENYRFAGWYTDTTYSAEANLGILDDINTTVYAKWDAITDNLEYVYKTPGTCIFGGQNTSITSNTNSCISYINPSGELTNYASDLADFIDTEVSLYSETNVGKDFEVGFTIDNYNGSSNEQFATLFSSKLENSTYYGAGIIFRKDSSNNNKFQLRQRLEVNGAAANVTATSQFTNPITTPIKVVIKRVDGKIYYSFNNGAMTQLDDREIKPTFNLHALFGATVNSSVTAAAEIGPTERYLIGTLSELYIKLEATNQKIVTLDAGDGTVNPSTLRYAVGSAVGELPTPVYEGYYFDGWYTDPDPNEGTKVTAETIILDDITFYAHYKEYVEVIFDGQGGTVSISPNTMQVPIGEPINPLPTASKPSLCFNGWYTEAEEGTKYNGEAIVADTTLYAYYSSSCVVTFDATGGTVSPTTKDVAYNTAIGELPTPTYEGYIFDGWFTDTTFSTQVTEQTVIDTDTTIFAKWIVNNYVAQIGSNYYESLQAAITAVPTNGTKTTVKLLKDVSESVTITGRRNVYLDLNNHTVSNTGDANVFHVVSNGAFEPVNGTIATTAGTKAAIENDQSTVLKFGNITIQANGGRQAIYNYGGNVTISDGAVITGSAPARAVIQNKNDGTMVITGGTITSTTLYAVYNEGGSLTIGTADGNIDATTPVIQGETYGVVAYVKFNFFDGVIKGKTAPIGKTDASGNTPTVYTDTNETMLSSIEAYSEKVNGEDGNYHTLYLIPKVVPTYTYSIRVDVPDTLPNNPNTTVKSPLVPAWTLGSSSYSTSGNTQEYEGILVTKTATPIDITDIPTGGGSTYEPYIEDWYNTIGEGAYYVPAMDNSCRQVKITMDSGYENSGRKNPKVVFMQGTSPKTLVVNGINDGSGGSTDIPNTFGERQITDNPTLNYQIQNGSVIDLNPYWDDTLEYHAISIRGYSGSSVNNIKGATIEFTCEQGAQNPSYYSLGTVTRSVSKNFQGALADEENDELFQILDGGHTMVVDMESLAVIREFDLPTSDGSGHFSSVEWLDKENKIFMTTSGVCSATANANKIYVYDMSDESNITMTTVTTADMPSANYSCMGDLAYDSQNKLLYVGGYSPSDSSNDRNNLIITTLDMSPYVDNGITTVSAVGNAFTTTVYHLQDGAFYNGKIYYLVDSTTGRGSYNTFAVLEINPTTKDISRVLEIPQSQYKEAESLVIIPGANPYLIMSYWDGSNTEYYYKKYINS